MAEPDGSGVPDLSGLPGWAQTAIYGLFAVGVIAAGVVARFGWRMGRSAPPGSSERSAQVAAVIVDPEALNNLTVTGASLNQTLGQIRDLLGQLLIDSREERQGRELKEEALKLAKELAKEMVDAQFREQRSRSRRVARNKPPG